MKPLVDKEYKLEKFPGKGGWTYARIPEVMQDKNKPFGWGRVRGTLVGYVIKKQKLLRPCMLRSPGPTAKVCTVINCSVWRSCILIRDTSARRQSPSFGSFP